MTIPIALLMGMYIFKWRGGTERAITEGTIIGVALLIFAVIFGKVVQDSSFADYFRLSRNGIVLALAIYGFVASVLPVWLLLCPRDFSSVQKRKLARL